MKKLKNNSSLDIGAIQKLRILANLRVLYLRMALGIEYLPDEYRGINKEVTDFIIGIDVISSSLALGIDHEQFIGDLDIENPILSIKEHYDKYNFPHDAVAQKFGIEYSFIYIITEITTLILVITGINYNQVPSDRSLDKELAGNFVNELSLFLKEQSDAIGDVFGKKMKKRYSKLSSLILNNEFSESQWLVNSEVRPLTRKLFPEFRFIYQRLKRLNPMIQRLVSCEIGRKQWRTYEEVCIEILEFLFVPEFIGIIPQSSVNSGTQRRDALLHNNIKTGFWGAVKADYECSHVLFEFKNVERLKKTDVLQTSNYLSKPGIGRFGIILTRKAPSKSAFKHIEEVFIFENKLILVLDDSSLKRLMYEKAYFGNCNEFLSYLKGGFERTI